MPDETLQLVLRLRDEATAQLSSIRNQVTVAAGAMAAAGLKAGADWDRATKTIVEGTGATGEQLQTLQADYQAVARYGEESATVIADLNTHLGLQGEELQRVAAAALKAGVDTNSFGSVAAQLGLDAEGSARFLDQLVVASQNTGVSVDQMTNTIGKNAARWVMAGGDMEGLAATVVAAADEFGPSGLRGAMSETMAEVDKGVIPAVQSLERQLGDTTGAVERTYEAGRTWRDSLSEIKNEVIASIGPYGDMVGGIGTAAAGLLQIIPLIRSSTIAQRALNLAMRMNPIGLVVTALGLAAAAIYHWREEITGFLSGAWDKLRGAVTTAKEWLSPLIGWFGDSSEAVEELSDELAGHSLTTALKAAREEAKQTIAVLRSMPLVLGDVTRATEIAGLTFAEKFNAGLMRGPGGLMDTIPQSMMRLADDGSWTLAGGQGAQNFAVGSGGSGGLMGGLSKWLGGGSDAGGIVGFFQNTMGGVSGVMSSFLNGDWKTSLGNMVSMGLNTLVPGLGTVANLAFAKFKAVFDWFRKPSETEIAARNMWGDIHSTVVEQLRSSADYSNEVSRAMADGWDRETAEMRAAYVHLGQQVGLTYDQSFRVYAEYEQAVRDGNTEMMEQLEAQLREWAALSEDSSREASQSVKDFVAEAQAELAALQDRPPIVIDIEYHGRRTGQHGGEGGAGEFGGERHTGGPVSAGVTYSTIPGEVFVPRTDGTVINPGLIDYGRLAALFAAALARTPVRVEQSPLALSALRGAPRIQAQRGWA